MDGHPGPHTSPLTAPCGRPAAQARDLLDAPAPTMAEIQNRYGPAWQIEIAEPASFIAIRRPTPTAQEIVVGHSLTELEAKLAAESGPDEDFA